MLKTILFLVFPILLFSQKDDVSSSNTLIVDYSFFLHMKGAPSPIVINSKLTSTQNISLYEMDFLGNTNFQDEEDSESGVAFSVKPTNNEYIFKDFKERSIYSMERVLMEPFFVKDTMATFNWEIEAGFKNVIGYKCQKASLKYRGRNYIAFFTIELPFQNGPWKFCGLPGLILEVYSTDSVFKLKADKLQIKQKNVKIENQYVKRYESQIVSWEAFISQYKKKYNELLHYRFPGGGSMTIPKKGIETYIE